MARVTAYEASDGSLHRDKKAYLRHEANLIVAKELRTVIDQNLYIDGSEEERLAQIENVHNFIVNGIGLNTLRDLFAIQFKPGSDDGEEGGAASAQEGQAAEGAAAAGADI